MQFDALFMMDTFQWVGFDVRDSTAFEGLGYSVTFRSCASHGAALIFAAASSPAQASRRHQVGGPLWTLAR